MDVSATAGTDGPVDMKRICGTIAVGEKGRRAREGKVCISYLRNNGTL